MLVKHGGLSLVQPDPMPITHRVKIREDHKIAFPEIWWSVFITGNPLDSRAITEMFARARCFKASSVKTADIVILSGGPDVNPALYRESPHKTTKPSLIDRDLKDYEVFKEAYDNGIPIVGIGRGAQFGHVMLGGKLNQNVPGHIGDHSLYDLIQRKEFMRVPSVHHQSIVPQEGCRVIATARKGASLDGPDIEAFFYREAAFLGFQGHPEFRGYPFYTAWCLEQIEQYLVHNPDLSNQNGVYRMNKDLIRQRKKKSKEFPVPKCERVS